MAQPAEDQIDLPIQRRIVDPATPVQPHRPAAPPCCAGRFNVAVTYLYRARYNQRQEPLVDRGFPGQYRQP